MTDKDKLNEYYSKNYVYGEKMPIFIDDVNQLTDTQKFRLFESKHFCMLPWLHLHGWPTGEAFLCCMANDPLGSLRDQTMAEIWNGEKMKQVRQNMLEDKPCLTCQRCYETEELGQFSMRNSGNKHFGHHITDVDKTLPDGTHPEFKIRYWDVRFSNICNFKCRYCGPSFSSSWWEDKVQLYGKEHLTHDKFIHAGRGKEDIWEQMQEHIPYLESIYFAGGEPLIMEEHYRLLKHLVEHDMTHVRLVYNTNFSELRFKKQNVLEWWNKFDSVSVGASLDAMGSRAEYMRKGTVWSEIEDNRKRMMEECPKTDFYISATVSAYNALHITDFHRDWVKRGFIGHQDFNINILHSPTYYRADLLPVPLKEEATAKINDTIAWLKDHDKLTRATNGYQAFINFMNANDNSDQIKMFIKMNYQLDRIRKEKFDDVFPELRRLHEFNA